MHAPDPWLGLDQVAPGRWHFELTGPLSRFDGKLYGGTGLAVTAALLEAETGRDALWATVQFVASAGIGEQIDCVVEVLAEGRRTSQVRVTATVGDRVVFAALGSTGLPRSGGLEHQVPVMPDVTEPEGTTAWAPRVPFAIDPNSRGWFELVDIREVPDGTPGMALWARLRDRPMTRSGLAMVADMVPSAVVRAAGRAGGGSSLDNAIRFGPVPECDWVLLDLDPHFALGGYVHGAARLWSPDGVLLGVASQTAVALTFD